MRSGFGDEEDKLVVITDGELIMNVVAFWRDDIPEDFVQKPGTKSRLLSKSEIHLILQKNKKTKFGATFIAIIVVIIFVIEAG